MTLPAENALCAGGRVPPVPHRPRAHRGRSPPGAATLSGEQRAGSCLHPAARPGGPAAVLRCPRRHPGTPARETPALLQPRGAPAPPEKLQVCAPRRFPGRDPHLPGPRREDEQSGVRGASSCREFVRSPPGRRSPPSPRPGRERGRGHSPGRGWAAAEAPRTSTQPASSPLKLPPRCLRCLFVPSRT